LISDILSILRRTVPVKIGNHESSLSSVAGTAFDGSMAFA
jgi:hypothetical protein